MTPAGSSIKILILNLLETYSGIRVGFLIEYFLALYGIQVMLFSCLFAG